MGRKKKAEAAKAPESPKGEEKQMEMPLVIPVAPDQKKPESAPPVCEEPADPNVSVDAIREDSVKWAVECGLKGDFMVTGPERINYPRYGHGYVVTIREETGKQRLGSARYTSAGVRSYWSIDGIVTG